jgi:hypothetical protein
VSLSSIVGCESSMGGVGWGGVGWGWMGWGGLGLDGVGWCEGCKTLNKFTTNHITCGLAEDTIPYGIHLIVTEKFRQCRYVW